MYKLVTLEKEEYENFTKNHIRSHFLHSYAWGEVSKVRGQIPHYLGVKENDKIVEYSKKLYDLSVIILTIL